MLSKSLADRASLLYSLMILSVFVHITTSQETIFYGSAFEKSYHELGSRRIVVKLDQDQLPNQAVSGYGM